VKGALVITDRIVLTMQKVGVAVTDIATGLYAHGAIMAAIISRQQTGNGVWIDLNLFETQV
jgi:succinate---hydroxymethylglutarate CoA-transferase